MTAQTRGTEAREKRACFSRCVHVPLCCQETEFTCGVACVQSILKCYGLLYRQDELAKELHSRPIVGTDYQAIVRFMRQVGFHAHFEDDMSIDEVRRLIDDGITPMLLIQAWADKPTDYRGYWDDNHYVIACGYAGNTVTIMDPYTLGNFTYLPVSELVRRWHVVDRDGRSYYRSGVVIESTNRPFVYDPSDVIYLG